MLFEMQSMIAYDSSCLISFEGRNVNITFLIGIEQEKELLERHNSWLNEELTAKVDSLIQLRKEKGELEADMSAKLADVRTNFLYSIQKKY